MRSGNAVLKWGAVFVCVCVCVWPGMAVAWELAGVKQIALTTKDGKSLPIGSVEFKPDGNKIGFAISLDHKHFQDFFLSMREFKCLDGTNEIQCHVPYPYEAPGFVTGDALPGSSTVCCSSTSRRTSLAPISGMVSTTC